MPICIVGRLVDKLASAAYQPSSVTMAFTISSILRVPRACTPLLVVTVPRYRFISSTPRSYAAVKAALPQGSPEDGNIMAAYTKALKEKFYPSGFDPKKEAFYGAPVSLMGIPAGNNVPVEITNSSVFDIGDAIIPLNTPTFGSRVDKYSERVNRFVY